MKNNTKKKIRQLKKINRDAQHDNIRRFGDICKMPKGKVFKDKKKDDRKYGSRRFKGDDE